VLANKRDADQRRKKIKGKEWERKKEKRLFWENSHPSRINGELRKQNEERRMDGAAKSQRENASSMKRNQTIWILYKLFRKHGQFLPCLFCSYWVCSFRLQYSSSSSSSHPPLRPMNWPLSPSVLQAVSKNVYTHHMRQSQKLEFLDHFINHDK